MTWRAASRNSSSNGSLARPDDSAEGVQDARAQVYAISCTREGGSARWRSSRAPRFYVSRWRAFVWP